MNYIKIENLTASGPNKKDAIIEFSKNLTIISGPSDTGKTYIFQCLNYLFGAKSTELPFPKEKGYTHISATFYNEKGKLFVQRELGAKDLTVSSNIDGIASGAYRESHPNDQSKTIGSVFLKMILMRDDIKIPKNNSGDSSSLTWRQVRNFFMVREVDTERKETILYPAQWQEQTPALSTLLYLLYEQNFTNLIKSNDDEKANIEKKAVTRYIQTNISMSKKKSKEMAEKLDKLEKDFDVDTIFETDLEKELSEIDAEIAKNLNTSEIITKEIISKQEKLTNLKMTLDKFKSLSSQYESDIKRLTFIVDGETHIKQHSNIEKCPYCENNMDVLSEGTYIEASKIELTKTVNNLNALLKTIVTIENDINDLTITLSSLNEEKNNISISISKVLTPKQKSITYILNRYKEIITLREEVNVYNNFSEKLDIDLNTYSPNKTEKIDYKPRTLFPDSFSKNIADNFSIILENMSFKPIYSTSFDMASFDIVVNGSPKISFGKGYRSLFNSALIFSLRKHFNEFATFNTHLYIIDSPLHGLAIPENIAIEEGVRRGLFEYLYNNYGEDQIIIFENTESHELPETNDPNIKIIKFTKTEDEGRYGFLYL